MSANEIINVTLNFSSGVKKEILKVNFQSEIKKPILGFY